MPSRKTADAKFKELTKGIDLEQFKTSVKSNFSDFPGPRNTKRCIYPVWFLFLIVLSGVLAGCNTIAEIALFAEMREDWFAEMIGSSRKSPSYDTIWWFLVRVNPDSFKSLMLRWLRDLPQTLKDQLLAIDGKRLRGVSDIEHISHIVELFAMENRLVIAQEKVPDKASERAALPELLQAVDVSGAIISMDALFAHTRDLEEVLSQGADYIVGLKGNQANLEAEVISFFEQVRDVECDDVPVTRVVTAEKGHGRVEIRTVTVANELDWLPEREKWHIQSVIEIRLERVIAEKVSQENRYYFSSRCDVAAKFAKWIRGHWLIENSLQYVMDVVLAEDASLVDVGHAAENLSLIRRLAMNIVKTIDPTRGVTVARRAAALEQNYLKGLLGWAFIK